jgi:IMP dehydrogenase/GMP reductase
MNRCHLQDSFEEGVQMGRSELAGILGKLFLKEGMRIQGETLALKRQNSLLKSMGVSEAESGQKKKSKKKKGNSNGPMAPSTPVETPSTPTEQAEEETPAPPPLSRDERFRLVVSGTRLSEQKVREEPTVEKKESAETKEKPSTNKGTYFDQSPHK